MELIDDLEEFDKFIIYGKTLELLKRHGIKPANVYVNVDLNSDETKILFILSDRTLHYPKDGSKPTVTNLEHHQRLKRICAELGGDDKGVEFDYIVFKDHADIYDKLDAAIEKAPKNFTRLR